MSENNNNPTPNFDLSNASAFGNYNKVSTSFNESLEKSILELARSRDDLRMSHVLDRFGNYGTVKQQIKKLLLDNKLVLYELEDNSIALDKFAKQQLKLTQPEKSEWVDLSAQPCLTCPIYNECGLDNPVSPASCAEMETWISEEIELLDLEMAE